MASKRLNFSTLYLHHAIKVGLACFLAYIISTLLKSPYPIWAVISTIIVMQGTSVAESLQASFLRFTGMAMGAVVGVALSLIFSHPENMWWIGCIVFALNMAGAYFFQYGSRYMIASVAATIILLAGHIESHGTLWEAMVFAFTLIWEIAVGVIAAALVSLAVWPIRLSDRLRKDIRRQFHDASVSLRALTLAYTDSKTLPSSFLISLYKELLENRERLESIRRNEKLVYNESYDVLDEQVDVLARVLTILRMMLDILNGYDKTDASPLLAESLQKQSDRLSAALTMYGETGSKRDPSVEGNAEEALAQAKADMNSVCDQHKEGASLHNLVRASSFFRLMGELAKCLIPPESAATAG